MIWPRKLNILISPFSTWVFSGLPCKKMGTQGSNICGAVSSSSWNVMHYWVVKLALLICRIVGSNRRWNLIWTSVPYHCFSYPKRGWKFSSPPSDNSDMVRVSERVLCDKSHALIHNFSIFLPIILFSVTRNIYFPGFCTMRLCAPQVDTVINLQTNKIITSRNVKERIVCMKPLTKHLNWKKTDRYPFMVYPKLNNAQIMYDIR